MDNSETIVKTPQNTESNATVLTALQLTLVFGASTATCENLFSILKSVFTDHRRSMLHVRKARLVQLAFEKEMPEQMEGHCFQKI